MAGSEEGVSGSSSLQTQALILTHWRARQTRNMRCLGGPPLHNGLCSRWTRDALGALGTRYRDSVQPGHIHLAAWLSWARMPGLEQDIGFQEPQAHFIMLDSAQESAVQIPVWPAGLGLGSDWLLCLPPPAVCIPGWWWGCWHQAARVCWALPCVTQIDRPTA